MLQDNNNNFDHFARKVLSEEPSIPAGFEWENMQIEIPKKKTNNRLIYVFVSVALLFSSFVAGFYVNNIIQSNTDGQLVVSSDTSVISQHNNGHNEGTKTNIVDNDDLTKEPLNIINTEKTNTHRENNNTDIIASSTKNSTSNVSEIKEIHSIVPQDKTKDGPTHNNVYPLHTQSDFYMTDNNNQASVNELIINSTESGTSSQDKNSNENLTRSSDNAAEGFIPSATSRSISEVSRLFSDFRINYTTHIPSIMMTVKPIQALDELQAKGAPKNEIALMFGSNIPSLTFSDENILKDKVESYLGNSFAIRYQRLLSASTRWTANIQYDTYHTVFQHSRELTRETDFVNSVRRITTEHIYKNNYSTTIGISTGISTSKHITSKIALQGSVALGAHYLLSQSGTTLVDNQLVALENIDIDQAIHINIQPSIDVRYALNRSYGLQLSYVNRYQISDPIDVSPGVTTSTMHQFLLGLTKSF